VYIYATLRLADPEDFVEARLNADELPTGVVVGTVEVVGCTRDGDQFQWHLSEPERLPRPLKPRNRPQPVWFRPF
jgi:hypothetical protein